MSSKRGRKRNDNLPPNRARDVQRAFRARRAAHLQALEDRVTELEEENDSLRAALHLPPANRAPLGRGPTGKDKTKPYDRASTARDESVLDEGSASPRTTTSSPQSSSHKIVSVSQTGNPGGSTDMLWDKVPYTIPQDDFGSDREVYPISRNPPASTSYTPTGFHFEQNQPTRSRSPFPGPSFQPSDASAYPHPADRASNTMSPFPQQEFYPIQNVPSGSGTSRTVVQSSSSLHSQHHMETAMGGGSHGAMGSHGSSFSPASSTPNSNNLNMQIRRSMNNPQHVPPYVDQYSPDSYTQRAQSGIPHQSQNNANPSSTNSRLPPGHAGLSRPGFPGSELSPTGEQSFRRMN